VLASRMTPLQVRLKNEVGVRCSRCLKVYAGCNELKFLSLHDR